MLIKVFFGIFCCCFFFQLITWRWNMEGLLQVVVSVSLTQILHACAHAVSTVQSLECWKCFLKASFSWVLPFLFVFILPLFPFCTFKEPTVKSLREISPCNIGYQKQNRFLLTFKGCNFRPQSGQPWIMIASAIKNLLKLSWMIHFHPISNIFPMMPSKWKENLTPFSSLDLGKMIPSSRVLGQLPKPNNMWVTYDCC